jgi:hypothetical protein
MARKDVINGLVSEDMTDANDNFIELYAELEAARDGEDSLLEKEQAQDAEDARIQAELDALEEIVVSDLGLPAL